MVVLCVAKHHPYNDLVQNVLNDDDATNIVCLLTDEILDLKSALTKYTEDFFVEEIYMDDNDGDDKESNSKVVAHTIGVRRHGSEAKPFGGLRSFYQIISSIQEAIFLTIQEPFASNVHKGLKVSR